MTAAERATCPAGLRLLKGANPEACPMYQTHAHSFHHGRPMDWADAVCGFTARGLIAMANVIENGVSRTVAAVAIVVIAAAICGVSWMAVESFVGVSNLQTSVQDLNRRVDDGFSNLNRRLDERGNNGRSGP